MGLDLLAIVNEAVFVQWSMCEGGSMQRGHFMSMVLTIISSLYLED